MTIDLEELKRLAQAAAEDVGLLAPARLEFRSKIDPAAVLALIERVERAEAQTEERDSARALQADRARNAEREARFNAARADDRNDFARRLMEAEARVSKLEAALNGLRDDVTGALEEAERQSNGASGMSVPYTGPFASGLRLPSVVRDLREQRRILDAALEAK